MAQEIAVSPRGSIFLPRSLDEAMKFADMLAKSDLVPKDFKGKPGNVLVAMQWGWEIGLQPLQALQNIAVINGRPSIWGDAALALVRGSAACESVVEGIEGQGDARTAICIMKRRGQAEAITAHFSVADAKRAGLWGKAVWAQYPDRMLQMRARGFAIRDAFPDVLRGVITAEEAQDYPTTESRDITPKSDLDAFASDRPALAAPEPAESDGIDAFGEIAVTYADDGTEAFRAWWKTLSKGNRDRLRDHLPALQARAKHADMPDDMTDHEDPFAVPGSDDGAPDEQHQPSPTADRPAELSIPDEPDDHRLPPSGAPPAANSEPVEPVMSGVGPRRALDTEATLKRLVAAFYELTTIAECDAFRVLNRDTIQRLREDEREAFAVNAGDHERGLREGKS